MRRVSLLGLIALALFSVAGTCPAYASRYCLQGRHWGFPGNCSFSTWDQCRAAASGTHSSCGINPRYAHQRR
jgi:hypothetical protein